VFVSSSCCCSVVVKILCSMNYDVFGMLCMNVLVLVRVCSCVLLLWWLVSVFVSLLDICLIRYVCSSRLCVLGGCWLSILVSRNVEMLLCVFLSCCCILLGLVLCCRVRVDSCRLVNYLLV